MYLAHTSSNHTTGSNPTNISSGCPVLMGNNICGESNSLDIMKDFNRLYKDRMEQVECEAGENTLQEKIKLQQEWVRNLTQQNEMLVRAVQELEYEATDRVQQLEEKLQKSAQCLCEEKELLQNQEQTIQEMMHCNCGNLNKIVDELELRTTECEMLKQEMADMRQALTEEVASKHDQLILIKKDVQVFKEQCMQADKQTAFKEDIIRELRKEIMRLKQQISQEEVGKLNDTIKHLKGDLEKSRRARDEEEQSHQREISSLNEAITSLKTMLKDSKEKDQKVQADLKENDVELVKALDDTKSKMKVEIDKRNSEIRHLKNTINELESALKTCEARATNLHEAEQMKNLSKQKRCYEEVIAYFKHEMGLMADQLTNLQELLTLSNESAQQESSKVMQAFLEVQTLNEKLSSQLCACEQKVQLENQLNQLNETKICELQQLLTQRELDISKHDEDVLNIRKTLSDSLRQNKDLQTTIVELNETIENLQCSVKEYERETCTSKKNCAELQNQIDNYCGKLEDLTRKLSEKTEECLKLKIDYDNEKRALKTAQRRLQEAKHHKEQNHNDLVDSLEDFKQKLTLCDDSNSVLTQGWENLLSQLANLSCKTAVEDLNIKRNRSDPKLEDVCLGCPCVMEFYHKLMDILKRSVTELKKKLSDAQQKNKTLEEEAKTKDSQITDLKKIQEELDHQLSQNTKNDKKIADLQFEIDHLTQELQVKSLQMDKVRKSVNEINGSKCIQLACAQEEISNLRSDLANILEREYALNQKTADLRAQNDKLHCVVNCLNEKNKMFEDKEDQYLLKIKNLNTEKDTLIRKNKELLSELRTVQSMTYSTNKQQSDILSMHQKSLPNQSGRTNRSPYGQMCASPCSLGSQGTASVYDVESPPPSLDFGDNNQWYSHTFQVESENESEDCYCVGTLENLTQQMRRSNKIWMDEKRSVKECNDVKQIK